jgi:cell division protease FtsH
MEPQERQQHINFWYWIIAFGVILMIQYFAFQAQHVETIPYSKFEELLKSSAIKDIAVSRDAIVGTLKEPVKDQKPHFSTVRIDPGFAETLSRYGVEFKGVSENNLFSTILSWIIPSVIFVVIWMYIVRRMGEHGGMGGLMAIGKSKAKIYVEKDTKVTFADAAGVDEAKEELKEVVEFLKNPEAHGRLGAKIPKGVLLVGPPGTGKTLLARAVAGEAGVPFFSISGSEFVEMFVGVGAARVRDLFEQARKKAPCIIFIDELDALGRARGAFSLGGHDEKEQTLNQLLVELDGFDPKEGIVLLSATNRPEILDPALLRAGRFDRQILVDRPDKVGRVEILKVHTRKVRLAEDVKLDEIAALTPGFTGADLANLVNEAALIATRRNAEAITASDFTAAVERIIAGLEKKNRLLNPHERKIVAHHEMGHTLVAMALPGTDPVHKVSIIPRGIGSLGYTIQRPTEDRFLMSRTELDNKLAVLLAGRAAESICFSEVSTGAADDLKKATDIARSIVTRFGMDETLGNVAYEEEPSPFLGPLAGLPQPAPRYSEDTTRKIDEAIRAIIHKAFDRATNILKSRRDTLETAAKLLLERETLDEAALAPFGRLMGERAVAQKRPAAEVPATPSETILSR